MEFTEEIRLARHMKTHQNKSKKYKRNKNPSTVDFDKPDFSQVM